MSLICKVFGHKAGRGGPRPLICCGWCGAVMNKAQIDAAAEATRKQREKPLSPIAADGSAMGFRDYFKARTGWDYPTPEGPARAPDGGTWEVDVTVMVADYLDALAKDRTRP